MLGTLKRTPRWPDARRRPRQPGTVVLDRAHPMAQGCVGLWLCHELGGRTRDLASVDGDAIPDSISPATWGITALGHSLLGPGTAAFASTPATPHYPAVSFVARIVLLVDPVDQGAGIANHSDSTGPGDWAFYVRRTTQVLSVTVPPVGGAPGFGTTVLSLGTAYTVGFTRAGSTYKVYVDGAFDGMETLGAPETAAFPLHLQSNLVNPIGAIAWARHYARTLSDAEMFALHVEPYADLKPIARRRYVVPAAVATAFPALYYARQRGA